MQPWWLLSALRLARAASCAHALPTNRLQDLISASLQYYGQAGLLDATPTVQPSLERDKQAGVVSKVPCCAWCC